MGDPSLLVDDVTADYLEGQRVEHDEVAHRLVVELVDADTGPGAMRFLSSAAGRAYVAAREALQQPLMSSMTEKS